MPSPIKTAVVATGQPEAELVSLTAMLKFLNINQPTPGTSGDPLLDETVEALIVGARQMLEKYTWRSLAKRTFVQYMDSFPHHHYDSYGAVSGARRIYNRGHHRDRQSIKLWYPPLISCDQITYIGLDGLSHTMASGTDYQVDFASEPGRIFPLEDEFWPDTMYGAANAVQIAYTAGYEVESTEEPAGETDIEAAPEPETDQVSNPSATEQVISYSPDRTVPEPVVLAVKQLVVLWFQNRDPLIAQAGSGGKFAPLPLHVEQIMDTYRCWDPNLVNEGEA
jgi:hypothetical protein